MSKPYGIRPAIVEDAQGIAEVHIHSWRETYQGIVDPAFLERMSVSKRAQKWEEGLRKQQESRLTYVAENEKGKIVGFISGGRGRDKDIPYSGELYAIYILQSDQRKKLGQGLLTQLVDFLKLQGHNSMYVEVLKDNPFKSFYKKYGASLFKTDTYEIGNKTHELEIYVWEKLDSMLG